MSKSESAMSQRAMQRLCFYLLIGLTLYASLAGAA